MYVQLHRYLFTNNIKSEVRREIKSNHQTPARGTELRYTFACHFPFGIAPLDEESVAPSAVEKCRARRRKLQKRFMLGAGYSLVLPVAGKYPLCM
jgi:hypothetical protein